MSHSFQHPNHRHVESFREERYGSFNHQRPTQHDHNRADYCEEEDYYCASKVEAPAHYKATDCCAETVNGRPGYVNYYGDKLVDYEFTQTVKGQDVVVDDCVERKHHGRFNKDFPTW